MKFRCPGWFQRWVFGSEAGRFPGDLDTIAEVLDQQRQDIATLFTTTNRIERKQNRGLEPVLEVNTEEELRNILSPGGAHAEEPAPATALVPGSECGEATGYDFQL